MQVVSQQHTMLRYTHPGVVETLWQPCEAYLAELGCGIGDSIFGGLDVPKSFTW